MSAHTPGPWVHIAKLTASENHKGFFIRAQKAARNGLWALADVQPGDENGNLGEANARLIAVAPELLEALRAAYACLAQFNNRWPGRDTMEGQRLLCNLRDTICAATGRDGESVQVEAEGTA